MVEVFKTNIVEISHSERIVACLMEYFPGSRISFDLEDCDKILRAEGNKICPQTIINLVNEGGFDCFILD